MGAMSRSTTTTNPPHGDRHVIARVAACLIDLPPVAGATIQIFPAGEFGAPRGALKGGMGPWRINSDDAARLIARVAERANDLVVDFEHQSLLAASNGQPAPAAGWIAPGALRWAVSAGLFAEVRWTERAAAMIAAGEYKYLSPVFTFDPQTGTVLDLLNVALTNNPAIDGMQPVMLAAASRFSLPTQPEEPIPMLKELRELLQLADENPTEAQVAAATQRVKAKLDEVATEVAALKAQSPDPTQYAPVAALKAVQDELAALRAGALERDVADLVDPALADGRLLPAQEQWARELGQTNLAALKAFLGTAQPIAALKGSQTGGNSPAGVASDAPLAERAKAEWESTAALRAEFKRFESYLAYRDGEERGLIKIKASGGN
jgi:phage I-like protein